MASQRKNKNIFFCVIGCFLLIYIHGCDKMRETIEVRDVDVLNALIKKDPTFLNNKLIKDATLFKVVDPNHPELGHGLVLENMVIKNFVMSNMTLYNVQFKNVTFVDCAFIKTHMEDGTFENVKFIRGELFTYDEPKDAYWQPQTYFEDIKIDRVLFDGVRIGKNAKMYLYKGVVVMRNVVVEAKRDERSYDSALLRGNDLHVRIDRCTVTNETGLNISGDKSSAYITNSTFNNSMIQIKGTATWVDNCTITNTSMPGSKTVVVRSSRLSNVNAYSAYDDGKAFFVDNNYINEKDGYGLGAASGAYIYTAQIQNLNIDSGPVNIYDTTIEKLKLNNLAAAKRLNAGVRQPTGITELNLSNVTIKQGDWEGAELQQGKWNNVQLGPLNLNEAKIGVITGYRVGHFGSDLKFKESTQPLNIEKPPVPTLEELGLAQFWKENDFPVEQY